MTDPLTDSLLLLFSEKAREQKDPVAAVAELNLQLQIHRRTTDQDSAPLAGLRNIGALHLTHVIKRAYSHNISPEIMVSTLARAGQPLDATAFAIQRSYGPMTALTLIGLLKNDEIFSRASESELHAALTEAGFDQVQIVNALWIQHAGSDTSDEHAYSA